MLAKEENSIGEFLAKRNFLTDEQVMNVLEIQKDHPEMKFGEIAIILNYIDSNAINQYIIFLHAKK
jgi:hypothetical protein